MADIKKGPILRYAGLRQSYTKHLGDGQVATDGVVYSPVATFGTTAVNILNELINPGLSMWLSELEVGLTQQFTELTDAVGSVSYFWRIRSEFVQADGSKNTMPYSNVSGTYTKGIGSLASSEDTFSGFISVGSVPAAPVRIQLVARGLVDASMTGRVKNSSYIKMNGIVIPGA